MTRHVAAPSPEGEFERHRQLFQERAKWAGWLRWKISNRHEMEERDHFERVARITARGYATPKEQLAELRYAKYLAKIEAYRCRIAQSQKVFQLLGRKSDVGGASD